MLLNAGQALARTFRRGRSYGDYQFSLDAYAFLSDHGNYRDECLTLSLPMCDLWKLELEELQDLHQGRRPLPPSVDRVWRQLWANFFEPPHRQGYNLEEVLASGLALCEASQHSTNPIQFYL